MLLYWREDENQRKDNLQLHILGVLHYQQEGRQSLPNPTPVHWGDQQVVEREVLRSQRNK